MKTSIIIPVVREDRIVDLVEMIIENAGVPKDQYEVIVDYDNLGIGCPKMVAGLVEKAQYEWVMFLGDDTEPQPNFLKNAIEKAGELPGWGLVALNDGIHNGNLATHWLAHKKLAELNDGYFFHPDYKHLYCDRELTDIAQENGVYVYAKNSVIKHNHPCNGAPTDAHYTKAYRNQEQDYYTYYQRKRKRLNNKIALAFPVTDESVHTLFWQSMLHMDIPAGTELIVPMFGFHHGDIARIRHDAVTSAIDSGCSHILFLDTDQTYYDTDLIKRLMSYGKPIVGGMVYRRWPPFDPILNRDGEHVSDDEIESGGLVHVDSTGTGCMLIDLDVFWKIGKPYFETVREENGEVKYGEDINFCNLARKAGYEIYVDCGVKIGHLTSLEVGKGLYQIFKKMRGK